MTQPDTREQPRTWAERPPMVPLEIARSRLIDLAHGALPDLFDQHSAVLIAQHLEDLEQHYRGLLTAVIPLLAAIDRVHLSGSTVNLANLIRAYDDTRRELPPS